MSGAPHISPEDLALFALESLSQDEAAGLRAHLAVCGECQAELASMRGDLAAVALSVDQHPLPAGARERFAQRIAASAPVAKPSRPVLIDHTPKAARAGWPSSMGWAVAAVLLLAVGGLVFQLHVLRSDLLEKDFQIATLEEGQLRAQKVTEVLTAPTAQKVLLTAPKTAPAPAGRVVYLASRGELLLQADNLAPVPAGKTYELWVIPADGSAPIPAGLFQPDRAGNGSVVLPAIPSGVNAKAFGVTLEDAAGSTTPTAPILLAGAVPTSGE